MTGPTPARPGGSWIPAAPVSGDTARRRTGLALIGGACAVLAGWPLLLLVAGMIITATDPPPTDPRGYPLAVVIGTLVGAAGAAVGAIAARPWWVRWVALGVGSGFLLLLAAFAVMPAVS